jgi:flagellin-like protein
MTKKIKKIWEDITGVSPIIAVILMVAITVVLAATIYVWVSGFGGGGEAQPSMTLKQLDHGTDANATLGVAYEEWEYVQYRVLGAENAIWEDLRFTVDGVVCAAVDTTNTSMVGGVEAGQEFVVYAATVGVDIGDSVLVRDDKANKIILEIQVTTA